LLISAFFPAKQGLMLFSIYTIGIVLSVIVALVMKKVAFSKKEVPFVMELPPYRIPTLKNISLHMWNKAQQYLKKMGTVILIASILIWALGYFPRDVTYTCDYDSRISILKTNKELDEVTRNNQIRKLEILQESERQEQSYIGRIGHVMEPAIEPLGFDWKMGVSIISGLAAKEIVVSTMGVLYHADIRTGENSGALVSGLHNQVHQSGKLKGQKVFTPLVAFGFMLFILIYFPCIAVITAIKKESNWRWAVFTMVYTTAMAWVVAFAVYQIGSILL
jgi:ferrous iron transport protein B